MFPTDSFYYYFDQKLELVPIRDTHSVVFKSRWLFKGTKLLLRKKNNNAKPRSIRAAKMVVVEMKPKQLQKHNWTDWNHQIALFPVYKYKNPEFGSQKLILNGTFIVKFKSNLSEKSIRETCVIFKSVPVRRILEDYNIYLVQYLGDTKGFLSIVNEFHLFSENVEYAHPNFINGISMEAGNPQTEPYYPGQKVPLEKISIPDVWGKVDMLTAPNIVNVAVIDEGIYLDHPDLKRNAAIFRFDSFFPNTCPAANNNHGTKVACVVNALKNSALMVGVAYQAVLGDFRVSYTSNNQRVGDDVNILLCLAAAIKWKANVINISWSYARVQSITDLLQVAINRNIIVCCAAGNYYSLQESNAVKFPASLSSNTFPIIAVAASDPANGMNNIIGYNAGRGFGSCTGMEVTVAAPGVDVKTLDMKPVNGLYNLISFSGTSAATALITGIAALLLIKKTITPANMHTAMKTWRIASSDTIDALQAYDHV